MLKEKIVKKIVSYSTAGVVTIVLVALLGPLPLRKTVHRVLGNFVAPRTEPTIEGGASIDTSVDSTVILSDTAIILATNQERTKEGLPPLQVHQKLSASAKLKVEDMINQHYFEHRSPTGEDVSDLGTKAGYSFVVMGENLALGDFKDAAELVTAWMNSPGHRANILNTNYRDIGVYAARGSYQGRTVWFAVQHFGTRRSICPTINITLKSQIIMMNTALKTQEAVIARMRAQIERPHHFTGESYDALVTDFNAKVNSYNDLLAESQKNIALYNSQIVSFNDCLKKYQKTSQ